MVIFQIMRGKGGIILVIMDKVEATEVKTLGIVFKSQTIITTEESLLMIR